MIRMAKHIVVAAALLLQACSEANEPSSPDLTPDALNDMYAAGQYQNLIEFVRQKERSGEATSADYLVAAKANLAIFDPIGAAIAIEKIQPVDLTNLDEFVLVQGQTLMLEQRFAAGYSLVSSHEFTLPPQIYQSQVLLGDLASLTDKPLEALEYFNNALDLDPSDYRVHISRAQVLLKLDRLTDAAEAAQAAVTLAPDNSLTRYTLGTAYTMLGQQADAKAAFEEAIYYNEGNVPALLELTRISIVEQDYMGAEAYLDRVYSLFPDNNTAKYYSSMLLALAGDDEEAQKVLLVPTLQERENPHIIRLHGHLAYRLNELSLARAKFEQSLRFAPYDRATILALSDIYIQQGTNGRALELLSPLLRADSADIAAFSMASLAAAQRNDLPRAIAYAQRTIELAEAPETILDGAVFADRLDDDAIKVLKRRLATYYQRTGAHERASETLLRLFKEDDQDATSALLLFNLMIEAGNTEKALGVADTMIVTMPTQASGFNARGTALYKQGNLDEALTAFTQAIELEEAYVSAIKNRAGVYLARQQYLLARDELDMVLDVTPGDVQAQLMYVRALVETDRATEALSYFSAIFRAYPNAITPRVLHVRALGMTGEYEKAITEANAVRERLGENDKATDDFLSDLVTRYERIIFERNIE